MSNQYHSIVILTGAGISAESGIKTFRASDGLWEDHRIEDVATAEGFERNPLLVHQFYNQRRRAILSDSVQPNNAHLSLAKFELNFAGEFLLVTQNIDNLHEQAGSKNLLHMHGEILKMRCQKSSIVFDIYQDINSQSICQCCQQAGNLRPHIVWFGEMPMHMVEIEHALENCDLFVSIGTSGNVYPAAGFYQTAKYYNAHTVELNLEATDSHFDQQFYGPASTVVEKYLSELQI